jgi:hypothetical protein
MIIAEKPSVITRLLKKGMESTTLLFPPVEAFLDSSLLKTMNNKNAILQMNVNFEKKAIIFINECL